jgi:hypothetical protein
MSKLPGDRRQALFSIYRIRMNFYGLSVLIAVQLIEYCANPQWMD